MWRHRQRRTVRYMVQVDLVLWNIATHSSGARMVPWELCQQSRRDFLKRPSGHLWPGQTESEMPLQVVRGEGRGTCRVWEVWSGLQGGKMGVLWSERSGQGAMLSLG